MSPSAEDVPQTPERRSSSSALLTAFRTLTSGRPKAYSVVSSPPTAALTPLQALVTKDKVNLPSFTQGKSLEDVTSGSSHTPPLDSSSDIAPDAGTVIGGPAHLQPLLQQLGASNSLADRIAAAQKISGILTDHQVGNVLAIWYAASDLINNESDDASLAGFTLLASCVKNTELSSFDRQTLFDAIHSGPDDEHLEIRFQALVDLSAGGRNVEPFEYRLLPFVNQLLLASFNVVNQARKEKKAKVDSSKEEVAFDRIFKYVIDVTKFNATLLGDESFMSLLDQIIAICKKTTSESDITNSTKVINAIITYTNIPPDSLRPCLELLADIYRQLGSLREQTWDALTNIFRSHLGLRAVLELMNVLHSANSPDPPSANAIRGAFHVLRELVRANGADELPHVPMSLLAAIDNALSTGDKKFEVDVLGLINDLFENEDLLKLVVEEPGWNQMTDIIARCVEDLALSTTNSNGVKTMTKSEELTAKAREPDRKAATASFRGIESHLCALVPGLEFIHREAVINLFLKLITTINDETAEILVTMCAEDRLIYPSNADWLETAHAIATDILHCEYRPVALRVLVASILKEAFSAIYFPSSESIAEFAMLALEKIDVENEPSVLEILASFAVVVVDRANDELFDRVLDLLRASL